MRKVSILFIILVPPFLIFEFIIGANYDRKLSYFREVSKEVYSLTLSLEREIGYGGLIHNFKNYLLRPTEDHYRKSALANYTEAEKIVEELEFIGNRFLENTNLKETRKMLIAYKNRLSDISRMSQSNALARVIDQSVRYNDQGAINEITNLSKNIQSALDTEIDGLVKFNLVLGFLFAFSSLFFILSIGYFIYLRQEEKNKLVLIEKEVENKFLKKTNSALEKFAGIVTHDLKAPIRYIDYCAGKIKCYHQDESLVLKKANLIAESIIKIRKLIDGLLNFSKKGFQEPQKEEFNINQLISEVLDELIYKSSEVVIINVDINPEANIEADYELVKRVFANLISNSLKYRNDEKVEITISQELEDEKTIYKIKDNGIGINKKYSEQIFEPLSRIYTEGKKYDGLGIGLALVKSIVEAHGGRIWLDTEYTKGACFCFYL